MTPRSQDMFVAAYALARLGEQVEGKRDAPPAFLGVSTWRQAYDLFYPHMHDGRPVETFRSSIKNARDAYDAHLSSRRVGWRMQNGEPPAPQGSIKSVLEEWKARTEDELMTEVIRILSQHAGSPEIIQDLEDIKDAPPTMRAALIQARVGQGAYRADLMKAWGNRCAVTGCAIPEMLRASHVKAWKDSTNKERLDSENGLLLAAHLDALFDRGLISFADDGAMHIAPKIEPVAGEIWGVGKALRLKPSAGLLGYLNHHRSVNFSKLLVV